MIKTVFYITLFVNLIFLNPSEYIWPTDASKTVTAFFGEMRPHRYHTGIDIRTYGQNGKKVYAITDGYIYRINVSYEKYGNVLYLKHNDGNISVYAHLNNFNPEIQKIVEQLQFKNNTYLIDHMLEPGLLNVSKGDIIGYTGDTGGLSGPHLHFEIRDKINRPINPLNTSLGKILIDTENPNPLSIAFIPRTNNSTIDGFNFTQEYSLKKISKEKFYLEDTIKVQNDFGIALKVSDKVNLQPFSYGIYSIDLFVDDEYHYGIEFKKTSFGQRNQIYLERNYNLFSKNKGEYYQLFKPDFQNNSFVNKKSDYSLKEYTNTHKFKIIAKDANNNETEITGYFKNEDLIKLDYDKFKLENGGWRINCKNIEEIIDFECTLSNQEASPSNTIACLKSYDKSTPYIEIIDKKSLAIYNSNKTYNTLSLTLKTLNGETRKEYILLDENKNTIEGQLSIDHIYDRLYITFTEEKFTGLIPNLVYRKNGLLYTEPMTRKDKNTLSSRSFNVNNFAMIEDISIDYKIDDYTISKKTDIETMKVYPNIFSQKMFKNSKISITHNKKTFFDTTLIYIHNYTLKNTESIVSPFYIGPNSVPLNKPLEFSLNLFNTKNIDHCVLSRYDDGKWAPLHTKRDNAKTISSNIREGGIIGVLIDNKKPTINNVIPRKEATYKLNSLNEFEIFLKDDFSGVNYTDGVIFKLNGKDVLTGFNIYQKKLLIARVKDYLEIGKNEYSLTVWDNANNKNEIKGHFYIK